MLRSWHNFFFASSDPNGFITVDKPPLALWLETLSAKIFGFAPLSLLIPEGVCAVLAVALLYRIVTPRFGAVGGPRERPRAGGVPVVRRRRPRHRRRPAADPADARRLRRRARRDRLRAPALAASRARCWSGSRSTRSRSRRLLCVPGIAVGYLACAPGSCGGGSPSSPRPASCWWSCRRLDRRGRPDAGVAAAVRRQQPNNTEVQLLLGYNGFGRVGGQQGGPGSTHDRRRSTPTEVPLWRPGFNTPASRARAALTKPRARRRIAAPRRRPGASATRKPIPFGGTPQPGADLRHRPRRPGGLGRAARADRADRARDRRARGGATAAWPALIVLGGWMLVELADARLLGRDRAPLLRLGARARARRDGRRRRRRARLAGARELAGTRAARVRARGARGRRDGRRAADADPARGRSAVVADPARVAQRRRARGDPDRRAARRRCALARRWSCWRWSRR